MIVKRVHLVWYLLSRLILGFVLVAIALPLMWMLATSLRLPAQSLRLPPSFIPRPPFLWSNYVQVFTGFPFLRHFTNSVIVASIAVSGQLIASSMAAYAVARIRFRGASVVFILILSGMMVPHQVTIIPLFILMRHLRLVDTLAALTLPHLVFPLGVFLMRQFILTISKEYDDAAAIEGLGRFPTFALIIVPMIKPAILVSAIMHLLIVWNDFFRPLVLINSLRTMTLPLGLFQLRGVLGTGSLSVILAGVLISIIPPFVFFIIGQKYLMMGLESGGLKY